MAENDRPIAKWQIITPAEAAVLLQTQLSNRRLNNRRVDSMAADMAAGRWIENGETVKISIKGNLMDGQHRLAAIIKSGKPLLTLVVSGLPEKAMASIDQGRARSTSDVLGLIGVNNASSAGTTTRGLWEMEKFQTLGSRAFPPRSEIVRVYRANADVIQDALLVTSAFRRKGIFSQPAAALAYILISRVSKRAEAFYQAILDDDDSPPVKALNRLAMNKRGHKTRMERTVPLILKAWNAWVTGAKVEVLRFQIGQESFPDIQTGKK